MKTTHLYIFVDDGFPEASDYENNYVSYEPPASSASERVMSDVQACCVNPMKVVLRKRFWPCWPFR